MRQNALLSPHRAHRKGGESRAIDAAQITTVQDGKVWLFGVWRVAKFGSRFEATQALGMAVRQQFSAISPPTPLAALRSATITAATSWPITSKNRPGSGA